MLRAFFKGYRLSFWAFRGDDLRRKISCSHQTTLTPCAEISARSVWPWVPAAIRMCDALYVWISCQELPLISRNSQHLLGRMVGAEDLNPTAKWLNRPSLEAIQAWSGRTWPIFAPDFSRFQVTPFETMIGFETNSGAHHLPSTSNYIDYIHITI